TFDRGWLRPSDHQPGGGRRLTQPAAVEDDRVRRVRLVDKERVLEWLHHRKGRFFEEKPGRVQIAVGPQHAGGLMQEMLGLVLAEVREHAYCVEEREGIIFGGKRQGACDAGRV